MPKRPKAVRRRPRPDVAGRLLVLFAGVYLAMAAVLHAQGEPRLALLSLSVAAWALVLREEPAAGLPLFLLMAGLDVAALDRAHWPATWAGDIGPVEFGLLLKAALLAAGLAWVFSRTWRTGRLDSRAHRGRR